MCFLGGRYFFSFLVEGEKFFLRRGKVFFLNNLYLFVCSTEYTTLLKYLTPSRMGDFYLGRGGSFFGESIN